MASQALGFAELLGGGVLLAMGVSGEGVRGVLAGKGGHVAPLTDGGGAAAAASSSGAAATTSTPISLSGTGKAGQRTQEMRIALLKRLIGLFPGLAIGEGPGFGGATPGVHTSTSYHYRGLGYDINADGASRGERWVLRRVFNLVQRLFEGEIAELFYDPVGYYLDEGQKVSGAIGGHSDHLHISFYPTGS